ncbi:unnamed protein product, partial [Mesorhabditis belari]|uniref:Uncharacterized protein n=1 Tax=Mesorhabditis belari TaxID=2138241 RepID=A0AAF3FMB9_9BILA
MPVLSHWPQCLLDIIGPFFRLRVPPATLPSPTREAFPPRLEVGHPQLFPERPAPGDTVYIECFAYGNPVPSYRWTRVDGKPLPDRSTVLNHDRVLKIENLQPHDQTRYKCTAANVKGVVSGEVTLILAGPPVVLLPLAPRLVATESEWSLECTLPSSDLTSQVEWFRNARPLVPLLMPAHERRRFTIDHNLLLIRETKPNDTGIYECVVSNEIGSTVSSSFIKVLDAAPRFPPLSMPSKVFALKGTTLRLPCVYQASPLGTAFWSTGGGTNLPTKGRIRDQNGLLVIENLISDDAGLFFCIVRNRLGEDHAAVTLVVSDKKEIRAKNGTMIWESGRNVTCEVQHEEEVVRKPSFCRSIFGESDGISISKGSPPAPLKVNAVNISRFGVDLYWILPAQHRETRQNPPVEESFLIEVRSKDDRRWKTVNRSMFQRIEKSVDRTTVDDLLPNQDYQFRVRSVLGGQIGDASAPTEWIHTPARPPTEAPQSLSWKALDQSTIFVEWGAVEQIECFAPDHLVGPLTVSASFTKWMVGGLKASTIYRCSLTPVDPSGRLGARTETEAVRTAKPPPPAAPTIGRLGLAAMPDGHFTTIIEWTSVDFGNITDPTELGYKIFVYISETASDAVVLNMPLKALVDPQQPSARLDGLRLMYKYTVQVAAYNAGGLGPRK